MPSAGLMLGPRPSAAIPARTLNRPQTIRFTEPRFKAPRTDRSSYATTSKSAGKAAKRADSLVPPDGGTQSEGGPQRKNTSTSLFQSRSWSIFWDPRIRATTGEKPANDAESVRDPEPADAGSGEKKHRSFISRCKHDKLLHGILGMVILFGGALIVAGVVWTVTHQKRVMEDKRNFVCGHGIAGGPKCAVRLKGEKSSVGSASWVGGEVVDWWLKNHCVWRGKEGEWWCGSGIGQQEGKGDQVLPQGTWLEKVEEEEAESRES